MVRVKKKHRHRRALHGSLAASFATFVALTSHVIGGGGLPTVMGIVVPLALSTLVCVLLAGRRLSLPRLSLSVLTSQSLFHLLFSVFTPRTGNHGPANALERLAMHHAGAADSMAGMSGSMPHAMSGAEPMSDAGASMHAHTSPAMLLAHLMAAVLTIAMIYWSETLPAKIGSFLRLVIHALLPTAVRPIPVPTGPRPHLGVARILPRRLGVLRSPVLTRGPPVEAF
ncbi:hypothetical protein [Brevibacterium sp. UCMA 11754]|uniref:hypothetical protein n=1 Tax=Brevibacterium sp. UCMA 11754 TaxID=2749198 RepID=UPI001F1C7B90|nr:hypothetical protein [Brevibacterium sp. UCMA 11754]MCF2572770.1 hypothetical protein [Brevibacterium sp. UCMA 11754]